MRLALISCGVAVAAGAVFAQPTPPADKAAEPPPPPVLTPLGEAVNPALDPKNLMTLTDDPILGKAPRINGDEMPGVVAFTFDDGPNPETSPAVLDALLKYDVPATFFIVTQRIVGKHGQGSREVLARELASGFTIGSHSVTHPNLRNAVGEQLDKEIDGSIRTLATTANRPIGLFRPPYGALSGAGRVRLKKLGITEVIWSIDTLDWRAHDADRLRKKVGTMIWKQHGGVVLMHDVKPITAKVIDGVLDDLEAANCQALADGKEPIVPVSIHYFLRDGKLPRDVPDAVKARTADYKAKLPKRCEARPKPATAVAPDRPDAKSHPITPECFANPLGKGCDQSSDVGDFPETLGHKRQVKQECVDNPLAKGCS